MVNAAATDLAGRRVALTGAGGFLGQAVAAALAGSGAEVRGLLRHPRDAQRLRALGVQPVVAPLVPGPALDAAVDGCDTLVHLAYDVRADADANLSAFEATLAAARSTGIGRIVHASSVAVYDDWPDGGPISEAAPIGQDPATGYRRAKIVMEDRLMAGPLPAAILQPTIVWGPGSDLWTVRPMRQLRRGGIVLPEPCGLAPLVHVEDVARAFVLAVGLGDLGQERFLIDGPGSVGWNRLFEGYSDIVGGRVLYEDLETLRRAVGPVPPPSEERPPALAARVSRRARAILGRRRFDAILETVAALRPAGGPARPDAFGLALFASSPSIDSSLSRQRLGYEPFINLAAGLASLAKQ